MSSARQEWDGNVSNNSITCPTRRSEFTRRLHISESFSWKIIADSAPNRLHICINNRHQIINTISGHILKCENRDENIVLPVNVYVTNWLLFGHTRRYTTNTKCLIYSWSWHMAYLIGKKSLKSNVKQIFGSLEEVIFLRK